MIVRSASALLVIGAAGGFYMYSDWLACTERLPLGLSGIEGCTRVMDKRDERFQTALLNRGIYQIRSGNLSAAIADFSMLIAQDKSDAWAYLHRGNARAMKGEHDKALSDYTRALKVAKKDRARFAAVPVAGEALVPRTLRARGRIYLEVGEIDKASADYDALLRRNAADVDALAWRAKLHVRKGDLDKAIAAFGEVLALDPTDQSALRERALALARTGRIDEAVQPYSKQIAYDPRDADALHMRAQLFAAATLHANAVEDYNRILKTRPNDLVAFARRGRSLEAAGLVDRALADYRQALLLAARGEEQEQVQMEARQRQALIVEELGKTKR